MGVSSDANLQLQSALESYLMMTPCRRWTATQGHARKCRSVTLPRCRRDCAEGKLMASIRTQSQISEGRQLFSVGALSLFRRLDGLLLFKLLRL